MFSLLALEYYSFYLLHLSEKYSYFLSSFSSLNLSHFSKSFSYSIKRLHSNEMNSRSSPNFSDCEKTPKPAGGPLAPHSRAPHDWTPPLHFHPPCCFLSVLFCCITDKILKLFEHLVIPLCVSDKPKSTSCEVISDSLTVKRVWSFFF